MVLLIIIKIIDNIIMTLKSIATYKGQKVISSILVAVSQLMFYFVIKEIVRDDSTRLMITIAVASAAGNYLGFCINDIYKKDSRWMNIVTSSDIAGVMDLNDFLISKKIRCVVVNSLNRSGEATYTLMIFADTKKDSKLIDEYLRQVDWKFLREVRRN